MNIFFVTGHDASAARKVDFHFWAESLERRGDHVDFMTVGLSSATSRKKNARHFKPPFNTWNPLTPGVHRFVWRPLFHPFSLKNANLDLLTRPVFSLYPAMLPDSVKTRVQRADVIVIESGVGLTLTKLFKSLAPKARFIYSCSDLLETLSFHPLVLSAERKAVPLFDMIRVPAKIMTDSFPSTAPVIYIQPGLDTSAFDEVQSNPYTKPNNAISIGDMLFNAKVIQNLAKNFPDWTFHLFGKEARLPSPMNNVVEHGEQPFSSLVPYLVHADIGIAPYRDAPSVAYISQSSLKMVQYTYCRLPIIAPHFAAAGREHVQSFHPDADEESLVSAFKSATTYDRGSIDRSQVLNWDEVTEKMFPDTSRTHAA